MTTLFPAMVGGRCFYPNEQSNVNSAWVGAREGAHRQDASFCLCTTGSKLPLFVRLYSRESAAHHYGLALWPGTGLDHDPDCRYFSDDHAGGAGQEVKPAFAEQEDGSIRAHLAFSLKIAESGLPAAVVAKSTGATPKASRARASESALLYRLWRTAALNVYRGHSRSWYKAAFSILKAAKQLVISRSGETLADFMLIASSATDRMAIEHNQAVLAHAKVAPSRLLVVGRLRPFRREKQKILLPLADVSGMPKTLVSLDRLDGLIGKRPFLQNLIADKSGHVVVLACIEPDGRDWWKVVLITGIGTSLNMVPAESSFEIEFENYLVDQGRRFIKPIAIDKLGEGEQRPDYILLDTMPRVRCEVWGMRTPEYLADKARKLEEFRRKGQCVVCWSANPREPFPLLPVIQISGL